MTRDHPRSSEITREVGSEIGLLFAESGSGDGPKMAACAALLALQHVNVGNGSVVPELSRSGPNALQFVPKPISIVRADVASAIRGYESIRDRIDGFVDGAASRTNVRFAARGLHPGHTHTSRASRR